MRYGIPAVAAIVTVALVFQFGCKDKSVEPPVSDPKSYKWASEHIAVPFAIQTFLVTIWGVSEHEVYVAGYTSNDGVMFKFDGSIWKEFPLPRSTRGYYHVYWMRGLTNDNVWLVGTERFYNFNPPPSFFDSSLVLRLGQGQWQEHHLKNLREGPALAVSVDSPTDIYIGGKKSIWQWSGTDWQKDTIPMTTTPGSYFQILSLASYDFENLFVNFLYENPGSLETWYYLFRRSAHVWEILDSSVTPSWGHRKLWRSPSGSLYSIGNGVFKWVGNAWEKIYESDYPLTSIAGIHDSHLFVTGTGGTLIYHDGREWFSYTQLKNQEVVFSDVWTNGKVVFVVGRKLGGEYSIVLRGST